MQKKENTGLCLRKVVKKEKEGRYSATLLPCELQVEASRLTEGFPWIHQHECPSAIASIL